MTDNLNLGNNDAANRSAFHKIVATLGINRFKIQSEILFDDSLVQAELFAFDSGQAITQVPIESTILIQVIDGEFEVSAANETVKLAAGSLLHAMVNLRQSLFCLKAGHLILFRFMPDRRIFGSSLGFA